MVNYKLGGTGVLQIHFAWLLVLIALITWREPGETQFLEGMQQSFLETRYVSYWHTTHKNKKMDNNITFYIYQETIQQCIEDTPCILPHIFEAYK
jgi:hypothetical protein